MKLHLCSGNVQLLGDWINIDQRYQLGVDRVDNCGILKRYEPESVEAIYCCHGLDHFTRWEIPRVLKRWHELLIPGGTLRLSVVDFAVVFGLYSSQCRLRELIGALCAAQDYEGNVRHMHWDYVTLCEDLKAAGFTGDIREVDPCPWANDCSHARIRGVLISLNLEATK